MQWVTILKDEGKKYYVMYLETLMFQMDLLISARQELILLGDRFERR